MIPETTLWPFGVYDTVSGVMHYIGLHADEAATWQTFLGWPSSEEVEDRKRRGLRVLPLQISYQR